MSAKAYLFLALALLVGILGYNSTFVVMETEKAVKFRFGEIIKSDFTPGLYFMVPFVNNVRKFEDRILTLDNRPERILTGEVKYVNVDFFLKWRITDVEAFYVATSGGDEFLANQRLYSIITDGLKQEFSKRTIKEVVSADRNELMDTMMANAQSVASELGIELIDVRVKRVDLPEAVSDSVFNRMRQERDRIAKQLRAEGAQESETIQAQADRNRTIILAEAYRDAQKIRGLGDATSAKIYAEAYSQNEEFYSFHRSMQAYRKSIGNDRDILVLKPDSEFFRYLNQPSGSSE